MITLTIKQLAATSFQNDTLARPFPAPKLRLAVLFMVLRCFLQGRPPHTLVEVSAGRPFYAPGQGSGLREKSFGALSLRRGTANEKAGTKHRAVLFHAPGKNGEPPHLMLRDRGPAFGNTCLEPCLSA